MKKNNGVIILKMITFSLLMISLLAFGINEVVSTLIKIKGCDADWGLTAQLIMKETLISFVVYYFVLAVNFALYINKNKTVLIFAFVELALGFAGLFFIGWCGQDWAMLSFLAALNAFLYYVIISVERPELKSVKPKTKKKSSNKKK